MNDPTRFKFEDRKHAGELLAEKLKPLIQGEPDILVLGLPRGGVPVAYEVAKSLDAPLDILAVRKLGIPGHEEMAMGAIAFGGFQFLDEAILARLKLSEDVIQPVIKMEQRELKRREALYRGDRPPLILQGRTVILVDDGIATGSTVRVALRFLREAGVQKVIIACPVCASSTVTVLQEEADEVVCVLAPALFMCVGAWYHDFLETSDEEVCHIMVSLTKNQGKFRQEQQEKIGVAEVICEQAQPSQGSLMPLSTFDETRAVEPLKKQISELPESYSSGI